jgi:hypothetical protein
MKRALLLGLVCTTWIAWIRPAHADVVSPPPTDCPAGSEGNTCHGGPYCRPLICATDADCSDGKVCKDTSLCVSTINCAGLLPPDADPSQFDTDKVDVACPNGNECTGGATCKSLKVCVASSTGTTGSSGTSTGGTSTGGASSGGEEIGGCSCGLVGRAGGVGAGALAILAAGASVLRRRQRDPRGSALRQRRA